MNFDIFILVLLIIVFGLNVYGRFQIFEIRRKYDNITKPMLMPLLLIYYLLITSVYEWFLIVGLVCGFLGDVFLLAKGNKKLFLYGLISFLLGHLSYIIGFILDIRSFNWWVLIFIGIFVVFALKIMQILGPTLGKMKIPVLVYISIIGTMAILSVMIFLDSTHPLGSKGLLLLIGALLFVASDSILAWQRFKNDFQYSAAYIMITYVLAQFCIVMAFV